MLEKLKTLAKTLSIRVLVPHSSFSWSIVSGTMRFICGFPELRYTRHVAMKFLKQYKHLTHEEIDKLYWKQIEDFGAPIEVILEEEASQFKMSIEEFLISNQSRERVKELEQVFDVLLEIEPGMKELSGGAPGSGKKR